MSVAIFNTKGGMIVRRGLAVAAAVAVLGVISAEPAWAPNCTGSHCTVKAAKPQVVSGKRQHKPIRKPDAFTVKQNYKPIREPAATGDMNQSLQLNLQQSQQSYTQTMGGLSNVMKRNAKTQQNVIQNMK